MATDRFRRRLAASAAIVAFMPAVALAHAVVVAATPSVHARIARGPIEIRLQFNSRIDVARSRIALRAPDGREQPVALAHDAPAGVLAAHADLGVTGAWRLRWQVLSIDGHVTRGEIPFTVGDDGG